MRSEFGLDSLPEHVLVELDEDAWVVNPAWCQIDQALKQPPTGPATCAASEPCKPTPKRTRRASWTSRFALARTPWQAWRARRRTSTCGRANCRTRRSCRPCPAPLRQLLPTLRMLAYRAETVMAAALAPAPDNPKTVRSLLKALFRSEASLLPDPAAGTLTVRLLHQASRTQPPSQRKLVTT